jgi:hypothetical protein
MWFEYYVPQLCLEITFWLWYLEICILSKDLIEIRPNFFWNMIYLHFVWKLTYLLERSHVLIGGGLQGGKMAVLLLHNFEWQEFEEKKNGVEDDYTNAKILSWILQS